MFLLGADGILCVVIGKATEPSSRLEVLSEVCEMKASEVNSRPDPRRKATATKGVIRRCVLSTAILSVES
jgi:hypothetical protein